MRSGRLPCSSSWFGKGLTAYASCVAPRPWVRWRAALAAGLEPGALVQHPQQVALGEQLGEEVWLGARAIEQVERNRVAAEVGEEERDLLVLIGPVGAHRHHLVARERVGDFLRVEDQSLVRLAGEAPVRG